MNCALIDRISAKWTGDKFLYKSLFDPTIASLLDACDVSLTFYAEGYD